MENGEIVEMGFTLCFILIFQMMAVLGSGMTLLRRCRVNAALTIQLFSQLFHFINMAIFNKVSLLPLFPY